MNQQIVLNLLSQIQNGDIADNKINPYHIRCTDHVDITKWLIESGANINNKGSGGETPLMTVAGQGKSSASFFHFS